MANEALRISHAVVAPPVYIFSNLPSKHYSDGNLSITSKARGSGLRGQAPRVDRVERALGIGRCRS